MRFAFIATEKAHYQVALLCRVLQVSRVPGSMRGSNGRRPGAPSRTQSLGLEIAAIFAESRGRYGSPRCMPSCGCVANRRRASAWRG